MSYQSDESILDHLDGLGVGASLLIVGLVVTIGDISIGALLGVPLMLLGVIVPVLMTHNAKKEYDRQQARPKRDHNPSDGYTISTKNLKRRR